MSGSALFVQPPNSVPIPMLADMDGQCYYVSGGISRLSVITPSPAGGSYTAGQCIGGVSSILGAARAVGNGSGIVYGATIVDSNRNAVQIDLLFLNSNVSGSFSTFTDKAEAVLGLQDGQKVAGIAHVTDWSVVGAAGCSVGGVSNAGIIYTLGKTGNVVNTTLFVVPIARATVNIPAGAGNWIVNFRLFPD